MKIQSVINEKASQCVKCGLCSQHCPTYQLTQHEAESPRGRIHLIQQLALGKIDYDETVDRHLSSCLQCRSCELKCPSKVEFGKLMDLNKRHWRKQSTRQRKAIPTWLSLLVQHRALQRLFYRFIAIFSRLKLLRSLRPLRPLFKAVNLLDYLPDPIEQDHTAPNPRNATSGHVAILIGCMHRSVEQTLIQDATHILQALGYQVTLIEKGACCGGLHLHAGQTETYIHLARQQIASVQNLNVSHIVSLASGCQAVQADYSQDPILHEALSPKEKIQAQHFTAKLVDINQLVSATLRTKPLVFEPLNDIVAIHEPCSYRVLHYRSARIEEMLQYIPNLTLTFIHTGTSCCGASGQYMLSQPDNAQMLRNTQINALKTTSANIVVTSNIGCQLHLRQGLVQEGMHTECIHPITLLARQLKNTKIEK